MPPSLNYDSPQALRSYMDQNGLGMRKQFGQNFLINRAARLKLLDSLELQPGERIWEVGPGLGAMTAGLLERGAQVSAFEIDRGFIKALEEFFGNVSAFTLIPGDVLKTWPAAEPAPYFLGNLPYNIAAALLADFIEKDHFFTRMVFTVQREVARRMAAKPGSADYSSLSVLCASAYTISPLMVLKGASFYPAPKIDSQGVRFDLRTDIDPAGYPPAFKPMVRSLFSARRKTVKNNLQNFISSGIIEIERRRVQYLSMDLLETVGINPNERAENLSISEFSALAGALALAVRDTKTEVDNGNSRGD